jgi:CRP-like cAMP-binding protein
MAICVLIIGEVIFHEGKEGDAMYFVAEGEVVVTQRKMGEDGKETVVTLNSHRKGDYFGEKALLERALRAGTVTA